MYDEIGILLPAPPFESIMIISAEVLGLFPPPMVCMVPDGSTPWIILLFRFELPTDEALRFGSYAEADGWKNWFDKGCLRIYEGGKFGPLTTCD